MTITCYPYGPLASNMYLIDTHSGCFIVDPSVSLDRISNHIPESIDGILITHGHFDHINALDEWHGRFPKAGIYISPDDMEMLDSADKNGSMVFSVRCSYNSKASDIYGLKLDNLKVLRTPGHSKGSVCLLFEEGEERVLFTGDTLFAGSAGRTDLYGGSSRELMASLNSIKDLDPDTVVLPGHGPSSTVKEELRNNPFFNF